jgi:hypothetical protein
VIGRLYTWRGATWRLLARGEPFDRGPRRNVLLERAHRLADVAGAFANGRPPGWTLRTDDAGRVWVLTGERVVRPFRGLRAWQP